MARGSDGLIDLFRTEVRAHVDELEQGLATAVAGLDAARAEPLARAAHSIKGAARIVDVVPAARLAEVMEERLDACKAGKVKLGPGDVAALRRACEMMRELAEVAGSEMAAWTLVHGDELEQLIEALRVGGPPPPPSQVEMPPLASAGRVTTPKTVMLGPPQKSITQSSARVDASLLDLFRLETETHVAELSQGLLALERDPGHLELVHQLMRAAHSIKGAARIVEVDLAVALAHAMEDCFVTVGEGRATIGPDQIDLLLRGSDTLLQIARAGTEMAAWVEGNGDAAVELTRRIGAILTATPTLADAPTAAAPAAGADDDDYPELPTLLLPGRDKAPAAEEAPRPRAAPEDRAVRVTVGNVNRIMNLAGETLVGARELDKFVGGLRKLGQQQADVADLLAELAEAVHSVTADERLIEKLTETRSKAIEVRRASAGAMAELETYARRTEDLTGRLYQAAVASRMRPFGDHVQGFPRLVRDLARRLDKKVELTIVGENVGVDRDILEKLEAPLNHLIRNAIDHGIEAPAVRMAAGKPERGKLRLEARHWAGMLAVAVSDDGKGIDPAQVRARIVQRSLATAEVAAGLADAETFDYLFMPGFSTTDQVTEISGRGVGLDVVRSAVQEVGGSVRLHSEVGHGSTFHLQLPITLSVIRAVIVDIDGEPYAFPLTRIERIVAVPRTEIRSLESHQYVVLEGKNVGLVPARQVLELGGDPADGPDLVPVVVLADRAQLCGIAVDRFLGEHDLVIRPLDPRLGKVADISAAAVMQDGSPVLIVDVEDMVRSIVRLLQGGQLRGAGRQREAAARVDKRVLVVDDSITVREVERQLLANRGYDVTVAVDGMDGWLTLRQGEFDLVITDVDMPRMNGIELVRSIKQDPRLRDTPVMIVSYKDREDDKRRGLEAGANYYLTKSNFHDAALLDAVIDLIGEPES
jgi:two-component system, chemotaxis family, sensor histidine kinase and response regulator WspE